MDFFSVHADGNPFLLLIGLALFPRITMLFVGGPFGIIAWLGWAFIPHFTVAFLATKVYWITNPELCIAAWVFALIGTSTESTGLKSKIYRQ